jgi:hypothetical protein
MLIGAAADGIQSSDIGESRPLKQNSIKTCHAHVG